MGPSKAPTIRGLGILGLLGPGLAMAAAGVGAGDVTTPALGAAKFGLALIWAPLLAGGLKYALNEGLARWQLATGETLLEGWAHRLGPIASYGFLFYLLVWSLPVFGTLASVSGVAANLLLPLSGLNKGLLEPAFAGGPILGNVVWSLLLVVACTLLVWFGRYQLFEKVMSAMTAVMVVVVAGSAILLFPAKLFAAQWSSGMWLPDGSRTLLFAILGGTGSTVGVLAYSYWMQERRREGSEWLGATRIDLTCCYVLSGVFGVFITLLVGGAGKDAYAAILRIPPDQIRDAPRLDQVFQVVAHRLEHETGLGSLSWIFKVALAAAVTSSLLGMLQSVPYFYVDLIAILRKSPPDIRRTMTNGSSLWYRSFLLLVAIVPFPLVAWKQPNEIVILYAVWGSLFMPFLAATLLVLNNRREWVGGLANGWLANGVLVACLVLFAWGASHTLYEYVLTDPAGKGRPLLGAMEWFTWK